MKLAAIENLTDSLFQQRWKLFHEGSFSDSGLRYPGVYLLAYSTRNLNGKRIKETDVLYVGMSNAAGGVRSRLRNFRDGIEKNNSHSAARRFYREYLKNRPWTTAKNRKTFYYVALSVECVSDKGRVAATDLRELGHIACLEFYAVARVREKTGRAPPLNKFGDRPVLD
jgi:hypothetical protein